MEQVEKKRKKVDLLSFQRTLNTHFLDIFESKKTDLTFDSEDQQEADLGLEAVASGLQFFLPLKTLKTISMDNSFEDSIFTKSWILGFNQLRGEIYTIGDFEKVVDLIMEGKSGNIKSRLSPEARIVYLKDNNSKMAFSLSKIKLDYTAELTSIFKFTGSNSSLAWTLADGVEFETFVNKQKMSAKEWSIMNDLNALVTLESNLHDVEEKLQSVKDVNLLYFIRDVYLDANGARPVFVLNTNNLTNYLANVSPY